MSSHIRSGRESHEEPRAPALATVSFHGPALQPEAELGDMIGPLGFSVSRYLDHKDHFVLRAVVVFLFELQRFSLD